MEKEWMVLGATVPHEVAQTDLMMPGMDGWSLAWSIKGESPSTPIGLVTGSQDVEHMQASLGTTFDFILLKPFDLRVLQDNVLHYLNDRRKIG